MGLRPEHYGLGEILCGIQDRRKMVSFPSPLDFGHSKGPGGLGTRSVTFGRQLQVQSYMGRA